jgi:hypothetical protein
MAIIALGNDDADTAITAFEGQINGVVQPLKASDVDGWEPTYLNPFVAPKSVNIKELPEGSYSFAIRAIDVAGNKSQWSAPVDVVIDRAHPVVTNNFAVSSANANELTVAWKGATDTGAGICQVNVVDEDGVVIQSSTAKNAPSFKLTNGLILTGTAQVFDCFGNGQIGELSISSSYIAASKSLRTGKWTAATTAFGAGAMKCVGKCTASVNTSGKFDVLLGSGSASVAVAGKTVASIGQSKTKSLVTSRSIDVGTSKKTVRISGSNFVLLGLASVTTTLGELKEIDRPPLVKDVSLSDAKQARLAQLGFRADDFSPEWTVLPMNGGTTLVDPSLDLCNGAFASEKERVERRQVTATKEGSTFTFLSTEVVKYSSVAAANRAQKELVNVLAQCQIDKGYKDSTGTLMPYEFKTLSNIPAGVVPEDNRLFVHTVIDTEDRARTLLGFYQFNGETFTGLYVMNTKGFTDAQVAKWLKVAVTMANRLQGNQI